MGKEFRFESGERWGIGRRTATFTSENFPKEILSVFYFSPKSFHALVLSALK
jgi:hypothetical protein